MVDAKYDPDRNSHGHFIKGNRSSVNHKSEMAAKYRELLALWYEADCCDDMAMCKRELRKLCLQDEQKEVKHKSIVYFIDRYLGKIPDRLQVDVQTTKDNIIELSPEEIKIMEKVIQRETLALPEHKEEDIKDAEII